MSPVSSTRARSWIAAITQSMSTSDMYAEGSMRSVEEPAKAGSARIRWVWRSQPAAATPRRSRSASIRGARLSGWPWSVTPS